MCEKLREVTSRVRRGRRVSKESLVVVSITHTSEVHEDTYTRRPITPRRKDTLSFRRASSPAAARAPERNGGVGRGGVIAGASSSRRCARRRRPRRTVPTRRARRPPGPAPCARDPPPARWSGAARTPRRWRRARRNTRRPSPPRARRARRHKSTATRRGSSSFFGCEARDGCPPLALEEEEDEASASSPFEANAARGSRAGRGARAAPKPRTPPSARLPLGTLERRAPWPSRADESLDASVSFADRFSDPRRARARASVRRRDDRGRGRMDRRRSVDRRDAQKKRVRVNKTRFVARHVSTCVTSPAPDSKIKPSTAVFAAVCLSESASASGTSQDVLKKKKWVPRSIAAPIFARSINYHVMPPSNHRAAPSAHTRAHRVRGVSARRRSPRVGDVVGIGAAAPPVPGGVLGRRHPRSLASQGAGFRRRDLRSEFATTRSGETLARAIGHRRPGARRSQARSDHDEHRG